MEWEATYNQYIHYSGKHEMYISIFMTPRVVTHRSHIGFISQFHGMNTRDCEMNLEIRSLCRRLGIIEVERATNVTVAMATSEIFKWLVHCE